MGIVSLPQFGSDPVTITAAGLDGKVDPLATEFNGSIDNDNIKASAGIVYSKLNLTGGLVNADISASAAITASKVDLGTIAQDINEAKGADVASATTTTIWVTDGNFIHVTGTTTITSFGTAPQAGAQRTVVFDGALTLTHNSTSLILPTGANITTAAGDVAIVRAETTANARVVAYIRKDGTSLAGPTVTTALSGSVIQTQPSSTVTASSLGSTALPIDNSIPQSGEGNAISALDTTITPNNASNSLEISFTVNICASGAAGGIAVALFQDSGTDAINAWCAYGNDTPFVTLSATHKMTAGTTSATTFKLRVGNSGGSTIWLNGQANSGARLFGGVATSNMIIKEIKA